ncbi:MAG: hypothetical protein IPG01_00085 [Chitinophagaceae bacterium]|nr:hypothetical protein [Chitinophagaceae bacterium]
MLDHFEFRLLRHKTLMRKYSGGIDWTRTRSLPSKLYCKRASLGFKTKYYSMKKSALLFFMVCTPLYTFPQNQDHAWMMG